MTTDPPATNESPLETSISFAEFLESTPPGVHAQVAGIRTSKQHASGWFDYVATPPIQLHCASPNCGGLRFFGADDDPPDFGDDGVNAFVKYVCRNCGQTSKTYALALYAEGQATKGEAVKYGELPPFGPPVPSRLLSLVGPDRDAYLKGRRSENQGLGIGAYAYYRRIVEDQKSRLIDEIIRVAERTQAPPEMIATLKAARDETQFSKAVETVKEGVPDSLKIDGHNPLVLLHSALSEGIHAQTDAECLDLANSIRLVLEELAERAATALKDHAELRSAVGRLIKKSGK